LNTRQRILWQRVICLDQTYWLVPLTDTLIPVSASTFNFALLREVWGAINRNHDAVMELATTQMQQLNIRIQRNPTPIQKEG
jgi:hypothetical protein